MVVLPYCYTTSIFSKRGVGQLVTLAAAHLYSMEGKVMGKILMDGCFQRSVVGQWLTKDVKHRPIISLQVKNVKQQKSNILILVFKTLGGCVGLLACKVAGGKEEI